ncbi:MAG: DNA polymerase III subunit gamma/tau, partial [Gemmataceae bacterium]
MAKRKTEQPEGATPKARKSSTPAVDQEAPGDNKAGYTVLARRYRPGQFKDLVGQEPVARALINALESNRVAHAYLFTGARGVGKTSTARILAKALNCAKGPTISPCEQCDICQAIAGGDDVDVLEIDGASNRGIDEVRELRRNSHFRPTRARFKIYIIDEVHMLTKEAFNALLKTLEEPPPHVKFIFATTEVQKIPLTILSRCQRFDFAGIGTERIVGRLREVVDAEKIPTDDEALEWIARRAAGSLRDAQSLLDQLLAFGGGKDSAKLTLEHVHRLLGTARDERVVELAAAILAHTPGQVLELLARAADDGIQLGELLDQLLDYWRDLMVVQCGGLKGRDLSISARYHEELTKQASGLSLDTILAGLDVLSATKARLRGTHHARVLLEMALVRLSRLEELAPIGQLVQALAGKGPAPATGAAKPDPTRTLPRASHQEAASRVTPPPVAVVREMTEGNVAEVWSQVLDNLGPMFRNQLASATAAISGPNALVLTFSDSYNREHCQEPGRAERIEKALEKVTGKAWSLRFDLASGVKEAAN